MSKKREEEAAAWSPQQPRGTAEGWARSWVQAGPLPWGMMVRGIARWAGWHLAVQVQTWTQAEPWHWGQPGHHPGHSCAPALPSLAQSFPLRLPTRLGDGSLSAFPVAAGGKGGCRSYVEAPSAPSFTLAREQMHVHSMAGSTLVCPYVCALRPCAPGCFCARTVIRVCL